MGPPVGKKWIPSPPPLPPAAKKGGKGNQTPAPGGNSGDQCIGKRTAWAAALGSKRPNFLDNNIDLKVLTEKSTDCNTDASSTNGIIASCSHLTRFVTSMRHNELLRTAKGAENGNALFAELCAEAYPLFLDDYAHFMRGAVSEYLGGESNGYHSFVNDTFRHFCARKTQIVLNLVDMDKGVKNNDFVSLVMNEVKRRSWYSDVSDDSVNLCKPVLFELFENVQELVVNTKFGAGGYAFNLERLSQFAFPKSLTRITIEGQWLKDAHTDSLDVPGWQVTFDGSKVLGELTIVR